MLDGYGKTEFSKLLLQCRSWELFYKCETNPFPAFLLNINRRVFNSHVRKMKVGNSIVRALVNAKLVTNRFLNSNLNGLIISA